MAAPSTKEEGLIYWLFAVGCLVGVGKLLASNEPITWRKALGHGIVSGGIGGAAALISIPIPDAPWPVIVGTACAMASLGASTLAVLAQKYLEKK